jgi:hypothetical protein
LIERNTKVGLGLTLWDTVSPSNAYADNGASELSMTEEKETDAATHPVLVAVEKVWRWDAPDRARVRNVPLRYDVHRIASKYIPPHGKAIEAVASFLRWRIEACNEDDDNIPGLLVLLSSTGTGKTSAGGWAVTWNHAPALYTTAYNIPVRSAETIKAWDDLVAPDLLVIDELGREPAERASSIADLFLDRDSRGLATILMGILTQDEFASRYVNGDESIASRLKQQRADGFDPIVEFAEDDLRLTRKS